MTDSEIVKEIIEMLNGPESPTYEYAYRENVIEKIDEVFSMYKELKNTLDEIKERIGGI